MYTLNTLIRIERKKYEINMHSKQKLEKENNKSAWKNKRIKNKKNW